jgi:hypothetical protein
VPAVGRARLAARPCGVGRGRVLGERGGLPLGRPSQLLDLGGQLTNAGLQPLVVHPQPLDLSGEPVALGPHHPELGFHHRDPFAQRGHLGMSLSPLIIAGVRR